MTDIIGLTLLFGGIAGLFYGAWRASDKIIAGSSASIILGLIIGLGGAIYKERQVCKKLLNMARTNTDSINVIIGCQTSNNKTTMLSPVYIPRR